jgi:hypothetical protein
MCASSAIVSRLRQRNENRYSQNQFAGGIRRRALERMSFTGEDIHNATVLFWSVMAGTLRKREPPAQCDSNDAAHNLRWHRSYR